MPAYAMAITMLVFAGLSARVIIRSINWLETDYWRHSDVQAPAATAEPAPSVLAA